ncbi:hypothetical protein NADFUDRAFT_52078 [Nadsonia fulvescens var. elongata DSM 6958]|uniref:Histone deacetylase interacting domain-containing protein n=1 Tax=Nadsonia fulvescens var. elongata DSM 6958 TaxID=857566 RepID=A0A1E3PJL0_9ASCO|nr:hypothetical protein NADFUDRAFT_52078 [Nadsonia fulvescens var. elongata DSM 6958]
MISSQGPWKSGSEGVEDASSTDKEIKPQDLHAPLSMQSSQSFTASHPILPPPSSFGNGFYPINNKFQSLPPLHGFMYNNGNAYNAQQHSNALGMQSLPNNGDVPVPGSSNNVTSSAGPLSDNAFSSMYRPLNVKDALSYLDEVKLQFQDQPDVYNIFLDIMKDFKSQAIDTPGVINRVSNLFRGRPSLIQGFNTFLPTGYVIESSMDPSDPNHITVTTPNGSTTNHNFMPIGPFQREENISHIYSYPGSSISSLPTRDTSGSLTHIQDFAHKEFHPELSRVDSEQFKYDNAHLFIDKIRERYANQPEVFEGFLDLIRSLESGHFDSSALEIHNKISALFKDAPDLIGEFGYYLPMFSRYTPSGPAEYNNVSLPPVGNFFPNERKYEPISVDMSRNNGGYYNGRSAVGFDPESIPVSDVRGKYPEKRKSNTLVTKEGLVINPELIPSKPEVLLTNGAIKIVGEEVHFFDRVKKFIGNKQLYNEFLKVLRLFSQSLIDRDTLVERVESFIGDSKDLLDQFKKFVGFDGRPLHIEDIIFKKHRLELSLCKSEGPSYKLLPKTETFMPCSGRDELCWEVLNDEWVGHPIWASEDSGFVAHRKNQYEEVLYKIEEERHDYDYYVGTLHRTIQTLETINIRISSMSKAEKFALKLPSDLGHTSTIYQKLLKKIYDREKGLEIIDALQNHPAVTVPILLHRLKQKDEEWRKSHREWNKHWRETEQKAFYKSLDHRGLTFKQTDKRLLTTKQLVAEFSTIKSDQPVNKKINYWAPRPVEQLQYELRDNLIIMDIARLAIVFIDSSSTYSNNDRQKLKVFLKSFLALFFDLSEIFVKENFPFFNSNGLDTSNISQTNTGGDSVDSTSEHKRKADCDLLRDVLKKARYINTSNSRNENVSRANSPDDDASWETSVNETDQAKEEWVRYSSVEKGVKAGEQDHKRSKYNMFCNTTIYAFIRFLQVLYERLEEIKVQENVVSAEISSRTPIDYAAKLGLYDHKLEEMQLSITGEDCYSQVLNLCEMLITGDVEHQWFEESLRQSYRNKAYKLYSIDKVVQGLVKHMHTIIGDYKSSDLVVLYENDRRNKHTTIKDQIIYRNKVRSILGPDENLFRVEWDEFSYQMKIQYITLDGVSVDDKDRNLKSKWDYYLTTYALSFPTEGIALDKVKLPLLKKNLDTVDEALGQEIEMNDGETNENNELNNEVEETKYLELARSGLQVRISEDNYKISFKPGSEDMLIKNSKSWKLRSEETVRNTKWMTLISNRWKEDIQTADASFLREGYDIWMKEGPEAYLSFKEELETRLNHECPDEEGSKKYSLKIGQTAFEGESLSLNSPTKAESTNEKFVTEIPAIETPSSKVQVGETNTQENLVLEKTVEETTAGDKFTEEKISVGYDTGEELSEKPIIGIKTVEDIPVDVKHLDRKLAIEESIPVELADKDMLQKKTIEGTPNVEILTTEKPAEVIPAEVFIDKELPTIGSTQL